MVGAAIGLLFTVTPLGGLFFETAGGPQSSAPAIWRAAGLLLASLLVALLGRKALAKTAVNRRVALAMVLGFSAQIILEIGGSVLGIKPATTIVLHLFNWFVVLSMVAIAVDRRVAPAAVGYLACFLFLCHAPQYRWYVMSAANFGVALTAFIAWRKPAPG